MGLFDLPAPLYSGLDGLLEFLPPYARLLLWSTFTAILSMALYWLLSAQEKVGAAKQRAVSARRAMAGYQGTEFDEMLPLAKESLSASGSHFLMVLVPAVLSSLPALTIIVWVSNHFSHALPEPGTVVGYSSSPENTVQASVNDGSETGAGTLLWPDANAALQLLDTGGTSILALPLDYAVPVVHQRQWWNWLIGNPNGYLPEQSAVREITFAFPETQYLGIGPGWMHGWEFSYFSLLILISIGVKFLFRID